MLRVGILLALAGCVAAAGPIQITITGTYPGNVVGSAPPFAGSTFTLQFLTDTNPTLTIGAGGYEWIDFTAAYSSGAVSKVLPAYGAYFSLGWGQGLDVRIDDFDTAGDQLQTIVRTTSSLYTGPLSNPSILPVSTLADGSAVNYSRNGSPVTVNDPLSLNYTAASIPEPATVSLALSAFALAGLLWGKCGSNQRP